MERLIPSLGQAPGFSSQTISGRALDRSNRSAMLRSTFNSKPSTSILSTRRRNPMLDEVHVQTDSLDRDPARMV